MRRKFIITIVLLSIFSVITTGQVTEGEKNLRTLSADTTQGWKKGGIFAVNLAQTSLTNWAAGGQNSVAINGMFSVFANLKKGKSRWDNSLDLGYGLLKQGATGYRKTDDKVDFLSKYGRQAFSNVFYAALLNFKTQMQPGYNYIDATTKNKISDLFAPAYLLIALGLDYKPNAYFSAFIAPLTAKFTFVTDPDLYNLPDGAFGVAHGAKSKSEMGGYLRAIYSKGDFKGEFMKNIVFTTKIDLFSNYAENPQNIDINWENLILMKVNKFITVNFNTHLIYDDNISVSFDRNNDGTTEADELVKSKIQFKEILGVGFSYKF
ncbi:MAG: DUF3078 domain-containing protein [Bacteroidales bacterium]|jgi:hypothetical protein|nr:DUF3078 domain-containing protein [Bacteroidales bacterium]